MNADRFDAVVQAATTTIPRRATLGGVLGAGLAALLSHLGIEDAEARKKRRKKKCKTKRCGLCRRCKKGKCKPQPDGLDCGANQACCGGQCLDLAADPENCGNCDVVCPSGECVGGSCTCEDLVCPEGCNGCFSRLNTQKICAAGTDQLAACASDEDCPEFGSFCVDDNFEAFCSIPCGG